MVKVYIELYVTNIDFESESFDTKETIIEEWELQNVKLTEKEITQLFNKILINKGDWVEFNLSSSQNQIHAKIQLLITKRTLQEEDMILIEQSKKIIESFLVETEILTPCSNHESNEISRISTNGVVDFLKVKLPGEVDIQVIESILKEMKKKGVNSTVENTEIAISETGASGGELEIIFAFVGGSVSSGITYDFLKALLKEIPLLEHADLIWTEERNFNRTKKRIAKRANVPVGSLVLIDFINNDSYNYIFKSGKNYMYVKLNGSQEIKEYKISKSRREVKEIFYRKTHKTEDR